MLRNQQNSKQLFKHLVPLIHQQRFIQENTALCNKSTNVVRQGKIMGKLFGQRLSGSKKRWFPSVTDSTQVTSSNLLFKPSQLGKTPKGGGKSSIRRIAVLNKLFMKHITDLMATGEISENILGKGMQVTRVKISPDFAFISVFWLSSGEVDKDAALEHELQRCSGLLRHELSQLDLMGVVPRIKFVKDKLFTNMNQVEALLRNMDFGSDKDKQEEIDFQNKNKAETLKQEFYGSSKTVDILDMKQPDLKENNESLETLNFKVPEMRHNVLGLDHRDIMLKILTKMRKSKQAWEQHLQNTSAELDNSNSQENSSTIHSASFVQLSRVNEKLANIAANSEKFDAFLAERKEKRNTPERKKFRASDHNIDDVNSDQHDYLDSLMAKRQLQLFEVEDYLPDEIENKKN